MTRSFAAGNAPFITFEGGEGAGKSTQCKLLAEAIRRAGFDCELTREPGGSDGAEAIRALLVTGETARWDGLTEALLNYAARRDHMVRRIRPAINEGRWVISDRFSDSTMAYQGYGHQLDKETIRRLHRLVCDGFGPDLTIVLDMPVERGIGRTAERTGDENRYERMELDFHQRVRDGFLEIARRDSERCVVIDGGRTREAVHELVIAAVGERLGVAL
jgi:dTMP kinase